MYIIIPPAIYTPSLSYNPEYIPVDIYSCLLSTYIYLLDGIFMIILPLLLRIPVLVAVSLVNTHQIDGYHTNIRYCTVFLLVTSSSSLRITPDH